MYCKAYGSDPSPGDDPVYAGDIQIVPFTPTSCATAMVTAPKQRPDELFLSLEFASDHTVVNHDPTNPDAITSPWSGDADHLTFGWNQHGPPPGYIFTCYATRAQDIGCTRAYSPCENKAYCCSGICGPDPRGGSAICL